MLSEVPLDPSARRGPTPGGTGLSEGEDASRSQDVVGLTGG